MPRTTTGATSGSSTERARPVIVELIRSLYRYNDWANGRILDASARLTCEQLLERGGASFDSVRDPAGWPAAIAGVWGGAQIGPPTRPRAVRAPGHPGRA